MDQEKENIPEQTKGKKTDTSESVRLHSVEEAKQHFSVCKKRLLDVSNWHDLSGKGTADFDLTNSNGNQINRLAEKGDYFKIDIPAPGNTTGEGKDWVRIEDIEDKSNSQAQQEYVAIHVRPASNPKKQDKEVAHFFKDEATSTFVVKREGDTVSAEVHGRNETPNTKDTNVIDTVRNAVVAIGAMLGFSDLQWKSLVKGLVEKQES